MSPPTDSSRPCPSSLGASLVHLCPLPGTRSLSRLDRCPAGLPAVCGLYALSGHQARREKHTRLDDGLPKGSDGRAAKTLMRTYHMQACGNPALLVLLVWARTSCRGGPWSWTRALGCSELVYRPAVSRPSALRCGVATRSSPPYEGRANCEWAMSWSSNIVQPALRTGPMPRSYRTGHCRLGERAGLSIPVDDFAVAVPACGSFFAAILMQIDGRPRCLSPIHRLTRLLSVYLRQHRTTLCRKLGGRRYSRLCPSVDRPLP